jgi:tetratricopeptide (TPR) repeat protein
VTVSKVDVWSAPSAFSNPASARWYICFAWSSLPWSRYRVPILSIVRALAGFEKALGADHTSTFETVNNLGVLYRLQGKLDQAEKMYERLAPADTSALPGPACLGPDIEPRDCGQSGGWMLGVLYRDQGKLDQAEQMYQRALAGYEKALGPDHTSTLNTVNNLGVLYRDQGKLDQGSSLPCSRYRTPRLLTDSRVDVWSAPSAFSRPTSTR